LTECTNVTDRQTPHDGKGRDWFCAAKTPRTCLWSIA